MTTSDKSSLSTDIDLKHAGSEFCQHLQAHGHSTSEATHLGKLLDSFVSARLPQLEVLSAVSELRELAQPRNVKAKLPYPGRRGGIDPVTYLKDHYGDEIRAGRLGPGRLETIDRALYASIYGRLPLMSPPMNMAQLFDSIADEGKKGRPSTRRLRALSTILGMNEKDTASFLSGVRPDRVRQR